MRKQKATPKNAQPLGRNGKRADLGPMTKDRQEYLNAKRVYETFAKEMDALANFQKAKSKALDSIPWASDSSLRGLRRAVSDAIDQHFAPKPTITRNVARESNIYFSHPDNRGQPLDPTVRGKKDNSVKPRARKPKK